jgi:phospholipase/carboxylesterase
MTAAIVYLHGYDDDIDTWDDPGAALAPPGATVVRVPGPLVLASGGRAWFETDERRGPDRDQVGAACAIVDDTITTVEAGGIARADIVLAGFSQGAALALLWARTTAASPIGAVVAIAGWFPDVDGIDVFGSSTFAAGRTLIASGTDDDVIPDLLSRSAAKLLTRDGFAVTAMSEDTGHDPRPFLPAARAWLDHPD